MAPPSSFPPKGRHGCACRVFAARERAWRRVEVGSSDGQQSAEWGGRVIMPHGVPFGGQVMNRGSDFHKIMTGLGRQRRKADEAERTVGNDEHPSRLA